MHYADICAEVRVLMVDEIEHDGDDLYLSSYFTAAGKEAWKALLIEACKDGNDSTLALKLRHEPYLAAFSVRRTQKGLTQVRVPHDAHEVIAESNFGRFYLRALCRHAIGHGIKFLIGYRALAVLKPRPGSQEKIGASFAVDAMLADLRATMSRDPQLGMPPGVGSGILARLP